MNLYEIFDVIGGRFVITEMFEHSSLQVQTFPNDLFQKHDSRSICRFEKSGPRGSICSDEDGYGSWTLAGNDQVRTGLKYESHEHYARIYTIS